MIRILIADDEHLIRQTLTIYLKAKSDFEIVGTTDNGNTAIKLIEELNPDIVLMDMEMPEMDGLTATKIISQRFPKTKILILSSHSSQDYIDQALQAGAQGYLLKSMPGEELLEAIKLIHKGYLQIAPKISINASSITISNNPPQKTKFSPNTAFSAKQTRGWGGKAKIKLETAISLPKNTNNLPSPPITNLKPNQDRPEFSSLPLASPDEFLPSINHWINCSNFS